jgi:hypothetical protein
MELIEMKGGGAVVCVSRDEVNTLNNALNEILNGPDAIDEREFTTRVGVTQSEAEALRRALHELRD